MRKPSFLTLVDDDDDDDYGDRNPKQHHDVATLINEPIGPRDSVELVDDSFLDFGRGHSIDTIDASRR